MSNLFRFGVSLERDLLDKYDRIIHSRNYTNRSEAIRDLIRKELVREEWKRGSEIAGAITMIYEHHRRELLNKITDIQHKQQKVVISTQHIHLNHHNCLEIIAVRGSPIDIQKLVNNLKALKGVKHVALSMSTTGRSLK